MAVKIPTFTICMDDSMTVARFRSHSCRPSPNLVPGRYQRVCGYRCLTPTDKTRGGKRDGEESSEEDEDCRYQFSSTFSRHARTIIGPNAVHDPPPNIEPNRDDDCNGRGKPCIESDDRTHGRIMFAKVEST